MHPLSSSPLFIKLLSFLRTLKEWVAACSSFGALIAWYLTWGSFGYNSSNQMYSSPCHEQKQFEKFVGKSNSFSLRMKEKRLSKWNMVEWGVIHAFEWNLEPNKIMTKKIPFRFSVIRLLITLVRPGMIEVDDDWGVIGRKKNESKLRLPRNCLKGARAGGRTRITCKWII
jgi:hypothetical protein